MLSISEVLFFIDNLRSSSCAQILFFAVDLVSMRIFFSVFLGFIYTLCCVKCDLMPKNDHVLNITINVQWFAICRWVFFC